MHPLISIIIPVYNTEPYLDRCVQSVLAQIYTNLEIILINDGSTDRSLEICRKYQQADARVAIVDQPNRGVSAARNAGLDIANGDYVAFLDSDDTLYPEAIDILWKDIITYEADIASGLKCRVKSDQDRLYSKETFVQISEGAEATVLALRERSQSSCAKLFRTSFIHDLRFAEGKTVNEDGFFMFECYMRQPRIVQRDAYIYAYYVREDSASNSVFSEKYLDMLYFLERKMKIIQEAHPDLERELPNLEVRTRLLFLQILCKTKDKKYKSYEKVCINRIRKQYRFVDHTLQNSFEKKLSMIVRLGLYPVYRMYMYRRVRGK